MTGNSILIVLILAAVFTAAVVWISKNGGWDSEKGCHGDCKACQSHCDEQAGLKKLRAQKAQQAARQAEAALAQELGMAPGKEEGQSADSLGGEKDEKDEENEKNEENEEKDSTL